MIKKLAFFNISLQRKTKNTMSKAIRIVVHCTGEHSNARRNKEYYTHYFFDVKRWKHYGYHAVVYQDGTWEQLQPLPEASPNGAIIDDKTMACGAAGWNQSSLHIAYVGGLDRFTSKPTDTRTDEQKKTLWALIACWKKAYKITDVVGHNQLPSVTKACPCFDAKQTYRNA